MATRLGERSLMFATQLLSSFPVQLLDMLGAGLADAGDGVSHYHMEWYVVFWSEGPILERVADANDAKQLTAFGMFRLLRLTDSSAK